MADALTPSSAVASCDTFLLELMARSLCAGCAKSLDVRGEAGGRDKRWHDYAEAAKLVIRELEAASAGEPGRSSVEHLSALICKSCDDDPSEKAFLYAGAASDTVRAYYAYKGGAYEAAQDPHALEAPSPKRLEGEAARRQEPLAAASSLPVTSSESAQSFQQSVDEQFLPPLRSQHPGLMDSLRDVHVVIISAAIEDVEASVDAVRKQAVAEGLDEEEIQSYLEYMGETLDAVSRHAVTVDLAPGFLMLTIEHGPQGERKRMAVPIRRIRTPTTP